MHTRKILSTKILHILIYILNTCLCEKLTIHDLKNIVSKNDSKVLIDSSNMINSTNPYCHLCCINISSETIGKHCGSHTLCKYPTNRTGPACKGYIQIKFTSLEKRTILDAHNTLRNIVASGLELRGNPGPQPSAANMRILQWNDELAFIAERWAAQCIYASDVCRDLDRFPIGQNIAHGNLATNNELSFIKEWYDQVQHFNKMDVRNFKISNGIHNHVTAKYSQLVWADTYQLGCARAVFQESKGSQVNYREHFICNYGPAGNIPYQPMYIMGNPCSACHDGTSCTLDYSSLCGGDGLQAEGEVIYEDEFRKLKRKGHIKDVMNGYEKSSGSYFLVLYLYIFIQLENCY